MEAFSKKLKRVFILPLMMILLLSPCFVCADMGENGNTLIVYYSRTGKSKIVSETLKEGMNADILEIKDSVDRSGCIGFWVSAYDSFFGRFAELSPADPDFSGYENIIMVSPIWNWNLCVPIRALIDQSDLTGKKLVVITTANIDIKKYEPYGEDAPFIKRFLRDYLREKSKAMREAALAAGVEIRGHFHIATRDIPAQKIREAAEALLQKINCVLSLPECAT